MGCLPVCALSDHMFALGCHVPAFQHTILAPLLGICALRLADLPWELLTSSVLNKLKQTLHSRPIAHHMTEPWPACAPHAELAVKLTESQT